jgi:hypothetical protein
LSNRNNEYYELEYDSPARIATEFPTGAAIISDQKINYDTGKERLGAAAYAVLLLAL